MMLHTIHKQKMSSQTFCLKWDGYQSNVTSLFNELRQEDELVDITLCCEGERIGAHRMMLSACSPYFRDVLKKNPCPHMVFYMKDTSASNLRALVEFIYKGSVNVAQSQLASFIKTAESLQFRGLSGEDDKTQSPPPAAPPPTPPPPPPVQRRPSTAAMVLDPPAHRRSAPAAQEHRLPPPPLPVPSPPAKRRRHVSSEFMAAVPISASAPSVISTPSETELNNVASAPSAVDSGDTTASAWEDVPDLPCPAPRAFNQPETSPHPPPILSFTQPHDNYGASMQEQHSIKTEHTKVEKIDLTEGDGGDGTLDATLGQVAKYEGYEDYDQSILGQEFHGQMMEGDSGGGVPCDVCGRVFKFRSNMSEHRKMHEGLSTCQVCGQEYSRVSNLQRHLITVHQLSREQVAQLAPSRRHGSRYQQSFNEQN